MGPGGAAQGAHARKGLGLGVISVRFGGGVGGVLNKALFRACSGWSSKVAVGEKW